MASLREIKDHIGSVRSTLKITGAMKLVASAKLRKAQQAVEGIGPYSGALSEMLSTVLASRPGIDASAWLSAAGGHRDGESGSPEGKTAVVALSSNSSLCGAFNVNVVRVLRQTVDEIEGQGGEVEIITVGRKVTEAVRKWGRASSEDYTTLAAHPTFEQASSLAAKLLDGYAAGTYSRVVFVYNHFITASLQRVRVEDYLPAFTLPDAVSADAPSGGNEDFILEPSAEELLATLLPQVMRLRVYTVILDSSAAEHAARTMAMQAASDNAEDLLAELTLEYNKGRQQKITAEILDLAGGAQQ